MTVLPTIAAESLMALAIALLAVSLEPVFAILKMLPVGWLRKSWFALGLLIVLFLAGYILLARSLLHAVLGTQLILVVLIMFLGACFVTSVTQLSRKTAKDLLHMGTLKRQLDVDPLTGLFNRRYLEHRFPEEVERAVRYGKPLAILLIDLDRFKSVNDTYGHQMGDRVLTQVGEVVSSNIRSKDVAVRYGGEELLVVAPETDTEAACVLAERLRLTVQALSIQKDDRSTFGISISIGVAQLSPDDTPSALISRADRALYEAKRNGRNRVVNTV